MATILEKKKGGPYSKREQEQRRNEVYSLHFERGYSAVKIAEKINVNRNTINEDIKYWYSQISSEFENSNLLTLWALKQYERFENQRGRLLDELERQEKLRDKIMLEKAILDIDTKISDLMSKINPTNIKEISSPEISEDEIKRITRKIIFEPFFSTSLEQENIILKIIEMTKCNRSRAKEVFEKMEELGLGLNRSTDDILGDNYDLLLFAGLREYLDKKEIDGIYEQIEKREDILEVAEKTQQEYGPKYGSDRAKWPKEALEDIRKQLDD